MWTMVRNRINREFAKRTVKSTSEWKYGFNELVFNLRLASLGVALELGKQNLYRALHCGAPITHVARWIWFLHVNNNVGAEPLPDGDL